VIVNVDVEVARPRDQVFDLMADARNEPAWNSQVSRTELISEEPIGQGTEFTTTNRGQEYVAILTSYDRPSSLAFSVVGKTMEIAATLRFADAADGGTRMTGSFDLQPKGFMKVMMPLMAGAVRKDFPKQMASFAKFCESFAGS
jgi:uncharacterized membrane protein